MNNLDISSKLYFLIIIFFSSGIFLTTMWFRRANIFTRLFGISFMTPIILHSFAFIEQNISVSVTLSRLAIPAFTLSLLVLHLLKPTKQSFKVISFGNYLFPIVVVWLVFNFAFIQKFASKPVNILAIVIILLIANLFILKKMDGNESYIFWALIPMAGASITSYYSKAGSSLSFLTPLLGFTAFCLFCVYFYFEYYKNLISLTEESEKRMQRIDRSLDMEVKKRMMEIERVNQNLVNISRVDSLTKALNKGAIINAIDQIINSNSNSEFSILMFDIDNFKTINDTFGHVVGDKCIKSLAATAKINLREGDLIGRYGGDEFIIVLPGASIDHALQIAERFRIKIESSDQPHYTISMGIATYPTDGSTVKALIQVADDGLYKSKDKGKNAVSYKDIY